MITNAVTLEQGVTVTQLKGQIYLVAVDGSRKLLAEGDVLPKGAVIMSPDGASFMGGGQSFNVQPASEQGEPAEEGDAPQLAQNGAAGTPDDINALQQAILGGADPTQAFEASAAGGAPAAGGGGIGGVAGASGNGGFVTIDRTGSATIAEATFDTTYNTNGEPPLGAAGEDEVFDLTPPTISVVAPDNTNDTTPTLTGTTDAPVGSIVTLLVTDANGNQQTLTATVTPAGTFTVDVVTPLAEGSYTVTATVTDPAGNTGSATDSGSVDVTAPVITVDAPDNSNDTTPTITGTTDAPAGSTVTLVVTDANGTQQTLTATVQPGGGYSVDVTTPLAEGSYQVTASVTDPAGNTGTATDDGSVDVTAPTITVDAPDNSNDTTPTITGTTDAPAGSTVTLVVTDANGNPQTLTTTVQPGGGYSVDVTTPLAEGSYTVTATVTDPAGNTGNAIDQGSVDPTTIKDVAVNNTDAKAEEGTPLTFKVTLSAASEQATSHSFSLAGVTAGEGDFNRAGVTFSNNVTYDASTGKITVPAGVTEFTVTVPTVNDSVDEADETLKLAVGGKDAIGTIVDNDALPTIKEVAVNNEGAKAEEGQDLTFKVTLSAASEQATSHSFSLAGVTAGEGDFNRAGVTFSNNVTYDASTGKITVPAGVTEFTVTVPTVNDSVDEADETLKLAVGGKDAIGTIVDNDDAPITSGGYAQGEEDMPLTLKWSDFKASDVDTAADKLSIKITSLPADGVLQYKDANGNWQVVVENQVFTQAEIAAGKLQFKPDPHEASGSVVSGANSGADGNKLGDYASFGYQVSDGVNSSGNATFVVDIKPVVDGVTLKVELVSGGFVPGAAKVEQILSDLNGKRPSPSPTGGDDYLVTNGSRVNGGGGNDTIKYGTGIHFEADGGTGNDILIGGGSVTDNLDGGDGNDILIGGKNATSSVTLNAGAGDDMLIAQSLKASTTYFGGDGKDVAYVPGSMKDFQLVMGGSPNPFDYQLVYKGSNGANHDFYSVETLYLQDGKYEFKDGKLTKVADLATLKVDVDLKDTDGSERFTDLTITGLPTGAVVQGGIQQANGSWKVPASMLDQDGKLSLQVELPVGSQNIKVTVVAGSQEYDMDSQPIAGEVKYTEADTGFMVKPTTNPNGDNGTSDKPVEGGRGDDVLLGDIGGIKTSVEPGKNYNIALIVDTSGSMINDLAGHQNTTRNWDGSWYQTPEQYAASRMKLTIDALKVLATQLAGHDGIVNIALISFNEAADDALFFNGLNAANLADLIQNINSLRAGGGTNYEDAFIEATNWFNTKLGSSSGSTFENVTYFLTDGDPTVYNGNRNPSESDAMQKAIDAFAPLSGHSEVKAIGIGNGVKKENLAYFDNTKVVGSGSQYEPPHLLNDFSGNTGSWSSGWRVNGDSSGSVSRVAGRLELTDNAGNDASVFFSEKMTLTAGTGLRFDLGLGSNFSLGDRFSVQLQHLNGNTWVNVGAALTSVGLVNSGPLAKGDYRYVFTVIDAQQGWWDDSTATLWIDNLHKVMNERPPVGQPDIINTADQLKAVLVGSSTTNTPAEVGADVLHGGAGNDILFGDAINTDHLPWGTAGNPAKPADWVDGKGLDGLTQFLTLKNGYAPSALELYEYIKGNANSFDVAGDTRGGNDKLHGGLGDDILFGQGGDDELYGDDGKDILYGGTGSDKLDGGAGNDILSGGLGNDILTGGEGTDIFVWNKGDASASNPATDVITDFNKTANNTIDLNQKDVIDLSDLLDSDGGKSEASLKGLLSIFEDSGKVRLEVRDDTPQHNLMQTIVLEGHSFASLTGNTYTHSSQASQVIDYMLLNNMLEIDKPHG